MGNPNYTAYPADAATYFGLSCPYGGDIVACHDRGSVEFLGCCREAQDPFLDCLSPHTCDPDYLEAMSFDMLTGASIPVQYCDDPKGDQIWWSCSYTDPPFLGCCKSNPCTRGYCPYEDLVPAKLSSDKNLRDQFLHPLSHGDTSDTTSSTTTPTANAPVPTNTPIVNYQGSAEGGISAVSIAGIALGIAALLAVMLGFAWYWYRIRKGKNKAIPQGFPPSPDPLDGFYAGNPVPSSGSFFMGTLMDAVRRFRSDSNPQPKASSTVRESMLPDVPDLSMLDDQTQSNRSSGTYQSLLGTATEAALVQPRVDPCQIYIPGTNAAPSASPISSIRPPSYRSLGYTDNYGARPSSPGSRHTISGALPPMNDSPYGTGRARWESPDDVF
ncbi:hypothetical protein V8F20_003192 [Naviculisporaceae sp. PSN 640]